MKELGLIGSNPPEIALGFTLVFFSRGTPVAARLEDGTLLRTAERYGPITTKLIDKWLNGREAVTVPQERLEFLLPSKYNGDSRL